MSVKFGPWDWNIVPGWVTPAHLADANAASSMSDAMARGIMAWMATGRRVPETRDEAAIVFARAWQEMTEPRPLTSPEIARAAKHDARDFVCRVRSTEEEETEPADCYILGTLTDITAMMDVEDLPGDWAANHPDEDSPGEGLAFAVHTTDGDKRDECWNAEWIESWRPVTADGAPRAWPVGVFDA